MDVLADVIPVMRELKSDALLRHLTELDCTQVQAWLNEAWKGNVQVPDDFNWLGLAEVMAFEAREKIDSEIQTTSLVCAEVAISIYSFLSDHVDSSSVKESFLQSAMMLRAYMIKKLGARDDNSILDIHFIVDWFFSDLTFKPHDIPAMVSELRMNLTAFQAKAEQGESKQASTIHNLKELRRIKKRLGVLSFLYEGNTVQPMGEVSEWLAVRQQLP